MKQKPVRIMTILGSLFIIFALISSSSISMNLNNISKTKNYNFEETNEKISNGLAPRNKNRDCIENVKINNIQSLEFESFSEVMYGYKASPDPESIIEFYLDDPGTIKEIAPTESDDFLTGLTCSYWETWLGCENGSGRIWEIDIYTGEMTLIGGGGENLNSIAFDPVYNRVYGSGDDNCLYEIDPESGEQTWIGPFGSGVQYMIGMAFNLDGTLYGWDLGNDKLWTIDTDTGEATEVGSLGIDLNYAQDGEIDWDTGILWLTAYTTTGELYYCDLDTGECQLVGDFEGGAQITGSMFDQCWWCCEHDVALKNINYPQTGRAEPNMDMIIIVKNMGNNTETFDAIMEINKNQSGALLLDEGFDGDFPPEGWQTYLWSQCYDCYCSPDPPCACVYSFPCEDCDYSIISKAVNASEYKKCNLRFYWGAEYYYPQYCYAYIKYRRNENDSWKDVTPWDNPVGQNQEGDLYEIGIYGFDEGCGEALQIKWEFIGYYYYFNYICLDSVILEGYENYTVEYSEIVEDITLQPGEEAQIEFPPWTPPLWQNPDYENTWVEYLVHAFVILDGDQNPRNDQKWINIDLWYPWMHDIEIKSIDSPHHEGGSLPAQTFPVKATIRNVGQYEECCIPIDISIGEIVVLDTLLIEDSWDNVPPEGWYDEHKDFAPQYGWKKSYTSMSGGMSPEMYIPYYYALSDYVIYSYAINTLEYPILKLGFKSYINHYSEQGLYSLEAGYSIDKETWYTVWHEAPGTSRKYEVDVLIEGGYENMYIGFWVKGNPYYFNYWYIDDIELVAIDIEEEYSDYACQGPDIEPGEEVTFTFDDWTPEFLQYEETGTKEYNVKSFIEMDGDKNPGNDIMAEQLILDYWHDVGIDSITSPSMGISREGDELLWDNGEPDGRKALAGSLYMGCSNIIIDDFEPEENWAIQGGLIHLVWNTGYSSNLEKINVYIFEDEGECDPSLVEYAVVEAYTFDEYTTGNYYFGRPEIIVDFLLDEEIYVAPYKWYIGIQPDGINDDIAYLLTAESKGCEVMGDLPYWNYSRWTSSQDIWGEEYDIALEVHGNRCSWEPLPVYIQPGVQDIDVVVKNYGTFPKEDLTCYAEIWEYITDPENGIKVYSDEIDNINLPIPLGGEKELQFEDFTFLDEGRYKLFVELPASPDDYQKNNNKSLRIHVDDTNPVSDYPPILDPSIPDGLNGWYVSDVTVTLNATDPWSNGVSSGVKEIRYTINDGLEQVLPGNIGSFVITEDGKNIFIEYWAVDWVGNVETPKKSFTIDIDQTVPEIYLNYEVSGNKLLGWDFIFTATADDAMSGMDYVEFYLNGLIQKTVTGPGPDYHWTVKLPDGVKTIIKAIAYDKAGHFDSKEIKDPVISSNSYTIINPTSNKSINYNYFVNIFILQLLERFPLIQKFIDMLGSFI